MTNKPFNQKSLLFFMYFGLTEEEANAKRGEAIPNCIRIAFRDFQRNLEYQHSGKELEKIRKERGKEYFDQFEECKRAFRKELSESIKAKIEVLLKMKLSSDDDFDKWHKETCTLIRDKAIAYSANGENEKLFKSFSYGLAQKWLNMTLKNMLVMGLWDMSVLKNYMHIPVDSYIIEAACNHEGECLSEIFAVKGLRGVSKPKESWSKIDNYCDYLVFQKQVRNAVRDSLIPVDWEGMAWIAMAKIHANQYTE